MKASMLYAHIGQKEALQITYLYDDRSSWRAVQ
jgi:hypothetical protein